MRSYLTLESMIQAKWLLDRLIICLVQDHQPEEGVTEKTPKKLSLLEENQHKLKWKVAVIHTKSS
jgi:hypothetical protein